MTVKVRDLPASRAKRWAYHGVVALAAAWSCFGAATWSGRARESEQAVVAEQARVEADRAAADGVAAECGLAPFSDEVGLRKFPMQRPPFPTKRESACLQKVTQTRGDLINDRLDLDKMLSVAAEKTSAARRRVIVAVGLVAFLVVGVAATEIRSALSAAQGRTAS